MNINEIKDLMAQFDQSSLREFSYKNQSDELTFSKNERTVESIAPSAEDSTASTNLVSQVEVPQPTVPPIVEETVSPEVLTAEDESCGNTMSNTISKAHENGCKECWYCF